MPTLITKLNANLLNNYVGNIYCFTSVTGEIQFEDYINLNGFIAYLQNFTKVEYLEPLEKPANFGLTNQYNQPIVTLEISY